MTLAQKGWVINNMGWQKEEIWGYTNEDGTKATGWLKDNNNWYYLKDGVMSVGWVKDGDKWYYLYPNGSMVYSCIMIIDGKEYAFDEHGAWDGVVLSNKGAEFIGGWEGLYLKAYEDPYYKGNQRYWTIGYGTTYSVNSEAFPNGLNSTCTKEQAIQWLKEEAKSCGELINSDMESRKINLSQNQLDALISFAYNCGVSTLFNSTLYKNVINGVNEGIAIVESFQIYDRANGQTSQGLLKRRNAEANLFLNGDYAGNN